MSVLAFACILTSFNSNALAHEHVAFDANVSSWASIEVQRALDMGLVPIIDLPTDYQAPITRSQFRCIAMNYIAVQENCGADIFDKLVGTYVAEKNLDGTIKSAFSDGSQNDSLAYYLGLVQGRGDGTFDPNSAISRQEAAVMLIRAYDVCGGTMPQDPMTTDYIDGEEIADWALDSISMLASWNVMNGMENGAFMPKEQYSIEQCIVTFLRLYENAPISRKNGNIAPMFTYEQCRDYLNTITVNVEECIAGDSIITEEVDGPIASFIRLDVTGVMLGTASMYFLYKEGGIKPVDLGICSYPTPQNTIYSSLRTENLHFSENGQIFYCNAILPQDAILNTIDGDEILVHQSGTYQISIDVGTNRLIKLESADLSCIPHI